MLEHESFNLLAIYRTLVPKGVRNLIRPTVWSVFSAFVRRDVESAELKLIEKRTVQSAARKYKAWQLDDALEELDLVLRGNPKQASALHLKADILARAGRSDEARKLCRALLAQDPLDLRAIQRMKAMGLGYTFKLSAAEMAVAVSNQSPKSFLKASQYLNEGGMPASAMLFAKKGMRVIRAAPDSEQHRGTYDDLLYEYGFSFFTQRHFEEAIKVFKMVRQDTGAHRRTVGLHAKCLLELGDGRGAEELLRTIGAYEGGDISFHKTTFAARLQQGDIRRAHEMYRWRASSTALADYFGMPGHPREISLRSGKYADGGALFVAEGGPGDEIRMASTYNELVSLCGTVSISCDPRLETLMARSFPAVKFIPTKRYRKEVLTTDIESRSALTDQRLYPSVSDAVIAEGQGKRLVCSTLDVLAELRADRPDFRGGARLSPDKELSRVWRQRFDSTGGRRQVGISWRSMLMSQERSVHYLKVSDIFPLMQMADTDFWLLQTKVNQDEIDQLNQAGFPFNIPDIDLMDDFEGQAALISNLDVVVSPLSTMAELSGMLGIRTVVFCRTHEVTWRKNDDGSDVWYENGRLVTGDPVDDIPTLVANIRRELEA